VERRTTLPRGRTPRPARRAALQAEGIAEPDRHMLIIRGGWVSNLLVSRQPFSDADLAKARELLAKRATRSTGRRRRRSLPSRAS